MKALRILFKILGGILALVVVFIAVLKAWGYLRFHDFYKYSDKVCEIPGLSDSFVPQGLAMDDTTGTILVSGYAKDNQSSVYLRTSDGTVKRIIMQDKNGTVCTDHFGGIAIEDDYLFVSGGDGSANGRQFVYTYSLISILSLEDGASLKALSESDVAVGTAFLYAKDDILYVGEFNHNGSALYEIADTSHYANVSDTESHKALMMAYDINSDGTLKETPSSCYSIPDDVQGFTMDKNGCCYMSLSWSVNPSHLYVYNSMPEDKASEVTVNGTPVPLYYFRNENLKKNVASFPMMEGITYSNGRIYVLNESASYKYIFGNLFHGRYIYSYQA